MARIGQEVVYAFAVAQELWLTYTCSFFTCFVLVTDVAPIIHLAIAVVIDAVARFRRIEMDSPAPIVAVVSAANVGSMSVVVFVEDVENAYRTGCVASGVRLAGIVLPDPLAILVVGTGRSRRATAVDGAILASRAGRVTLVRAD